MEPSGDTTLTVGEQPHNPRRETAASGSDSASTDHGNLRLSANEIRHAKLPLLQIRRELDNNRDFAAVERLVAERKQIVAKLLGRA